VQSAADQRVNGPRIARPGDVCVLLEPAEDEVVDLRQRQAALQARFGGCPQERVHLTCQRFELQDEHPLPDLIRRLRSGLVAVRPFPIVAVSLVQPVSPPPLYRQAGRPLQNQGPQAVRDSGDGSAFGFHLNRGR
jgi:hypothetical protein